MSSNPPVDLAGRVALVTGAARRIGAATATTLHDNGMNVAIHYRGSAAEANALCSARRATVALKPWASANKVVTSRNMMPGLG